MKSLLAATALIVLSGVAYAQEAKQNFVLVNKTGYDLSEIYISPANANTWDEDLLANGDDEFVDGQASEINFHSGVKTCKWDLKVVYSDDDSSAIWHDIDLCTISKVTIKYDRKSDTTSALFD